ncbi:2438_t:CDS:2, partial [Ambispora leptoticha]
QNQIAIWAAPINNWADLHLEYNIYKEYITQLIKYYKGFTKDTTLNKHVEIQKAVHEAISGKLQQPPSYPNDISENIQQILPFTLPIKNKAHTKAVVTALHHIYQFDQLPKEYIANLDPLPTNLANLHPAVRDLFPITDRNALEN